MAVTMPFMSKTSPPIIQTFGRVVHRGPRVRVPSLLFACLKTCKRIRGILNVK